VTSEGRKKVKTRENSSSRDVAFVTLSGQYACWYPKGLWQTPVLKHPPPTVSPRYSPASRAKKAEISGGGGEESCSH